MLPWGSIIKAGTDTATAVGSGLANKASRQEQQESLAANKEMFQTGISDISDDYTGYMSPYLESGESALNDLNSMDTNVSNYGDEGGFTMTNFEADPGYDWRMSQGMDALNQNAGVDGSLHSGGQQKALLDYAQNLASDEYQNVYDRELANYQDTRDYNTELDTANMNRDVSNLTNLNTQGYNATTNNAAAQLGLSEDELYGLMNLETAKGKLDASKWQNLGNTAAGVNTAAGDGAQNFFSFGQGAGSFGG